MRSVLDKRPRFASLLAAARGQRGVGAWLLVLLAVYLLLQLLFLLGSLWAAALPHGAIVAALEQGLAQNLWSTADYPSDGIGHAVPAFPFAGVSDAYTQCIALTMNVPTVGAGLWDAALAGRHLGTCSAAVPALGQIAAGGDASFLSYNRYWNGYAALTRPLLLLGGVGMVRIVIAVLFAAALVFAVVMLGRHVSRVAPLVLLPLVLSTNVLTQPTDSFPHALAFAVLLTGMGLGARWGRETASLRLPRRGRRGRRVQLRRLPPQPARGLGAVRVRRRRGALERGARRRPRTVGRGRDRRDRLGPRLRCDLDHAVDPRGRHLRRRGLAGDSGSDRQPAAGAGRRSGSARTSRGHAPQHPVLAGDHPHGSGGRGRRAGHARRVPGMDAGPTRVGASRGVRRDGSRRAAGADVVPTAEQPLADPPVLRVPRRSDGRRHRGRGGAGRGLRATRFAAPARTHLRGEAVAA